MAIRRVSAVAELSFAPCVCSVVDEQPDHHLSSTCLQQQAHQSLLLVTLAPTKGLWFCPLPPPPLPPSPTPAFMLSPPLDSKQAGGLCRGKRTGVFGAFLLAIYNEDTEEYQTISKIGTGFSEEQLKELADLLRPLAITEPRSYYRYVGLAIPPPQPPSILNPCCATPH